MFEPKRADGKSYREVALDFLKDKQPGDLIKYSELSKVMELKNRGQIQQAVRQATKSLLKLHRLGVQNVSNVGYRVLQAREHMLVANSHQTKADRQMVYAICFYQGTDLSKLTDGERKLHEGQHMLAQAIYASHTNHEKRLKRLEDLISGTHTINQD